VQQKKIRKFFIYNTVVKHFNPILIQFYNKMIDWISTYKGVVIFKIILQFDKFMNMHVIVMKMGTLFRNY